MTAVQAGLLAVAVVIQLVCAVGMLTLDDPFDRLHLVGPVSVFATILVVLAVLGGGGSHTHLAKVVVIGAVLWGTSPFLTRATARALRIRDRGRLGIEDGEFVGDDR